MGKDAFKVIGFKKFTEGHITSIYILSLDIKSFKVAIANMCQSPATQKEEIPSHRE